MLEAAIDPTISENRPPKPADRDQELHVFGAATFVREGDRVEWGVKDPRRAIVITLADARYPLSEGWRLALLVGVCGGFTTFSSFSLQTLDLLRAGFLGRALANVGLSLALCLGAAALGYLVGTRVAGT